MSIRLGTGNTGSPGANECLFNGTSSTMSIGTGDFSFGAWHYVTGTDGTNDIMSLQANVPPDATSGDMITTYCNSSEVLALYTSNTGQVGTPASIASYIGTWVYIVISRSGTTLSCKVYDDSSSTTPLVTISGTESGSFSCNYMVLGNNYDAELGFGDYRSAKVVLGDAWTDSEARAESASVLPTTGAGTVWGFWDLADITTGGLKDLSGNGRDLTNNSSYGVTQANDPTYLTSEVPLIQETGSGGSGDSAATDLTITMPTTKVGKMVAIFSAGNSGRTFTIPTGWTALGTQQNGGDSHTGWGMYRDLDNTEGSTVTVTFTGGDSTVGYVWARITGAGTGTPSLTANAGETSTPDTGSLSPAGGADDYLWLSMTAGDWGSKYISTAPTNYRLEKVYDYNVASSTSACWQALTFRYLNATTEDPGAMTLVGGTDQWNGLTLALSTTPAGTPVTLDATAGSYTITGTAATLTKTAGHTKRHYYLDIT